MGHPAEGLGPRYSSGRARALGASVVCALASLPALGAPRAGADAAAPAASPLQVPLDGITVVRVVNPGGPVTVRTEAARIQATVSWTHAVAGSVPRAEVTVQRRANLLDVDVRYPGARPPLRRHGDMVNLTLALPPRVNVDAVAEGSPERRL